MTSQEPLNSGGIMARVDISKDVMTFWIRRGLVRPIESASGTGYRLRFWWFEANIAAVANQLRLLGSPIEALQSIVGIYRDAIAWGAELGVSRDDVFAMWTVFVQRAFRDRGDYADEAEYQAGLDRWRHARHGDQRVTPRIEALATQIGKLAFYQHLHAFLTIMNLPPPRDGENAPHPDVTYFWRAGDRWRLAVGENSPRTARRDGSMATIAIDVDEVIYRVWNKP
jgi:hypothetical protein